MVESGVTELLFTSDNKHGLMAGRVPGGYQPLPQSVPLSLAMSNLAVFMTSNFKNTKDGGSMFDKLHELQPGKPLMVMEFWSGWFDHWSEEHHTMKLEGKIDGRRIIILYSLFYQIMQVLWSSSWVKAAPSTCICFTEAPTSDL
jgi:hypothetical protein